MAGGVSHLIAYGAQDQYLMGNPQISFFNVLYRRHTNFSNNANEIDFGKEISLKFITYSESIHVACPICCDDYNFGDKVHLTECGHMYHHACLLEYIKHLNNHSYNCPMCRKNIKC
jgi:hypothetical protein